MSKATALGRPIGILATIFGCWHKRLGRPFTQGDLSYRVCMECGARRKFDPATFKTTGRYFAPTALDDLSNGEGEDRIGWRQRFRRVTTRSSQG